MKVCLLTEEKNPLILRRLQLLGYRVQTDSPDHIEGLHSDTTDLVYLIPLDLTEGPSWNEQRVRLARASRFYLVFGDVLTTKQIMGVARDGAHDVLDQKDDDSRWAEAIDSAVNSQALWWRLYGGRQDIGEELLVGHSEVMVDLRESVQRLGPTDATVLIIGESGTGKERVSRAIHLSSGLEPFVPVNCAAIPPDLMESELFGVEKGAFTGANQAKPGLVEEAEGGTLFLDEIGEMDIILQPKLLRFLENRKARRVGSTKEYSCNVRIISATNRDLKLESDKGTFRLDLYYRLSEVILNTPPLREHVPDIPDLTQVFLMEAAERMGKNFETLEPGLVYKFQHYDWPGNVRELKQVIERLAIHYDGPVMREAWWDAPKLTMADKEEALRVDALPAPVAEAVAMPPQPALPATGNVWRGGFPNKREKMEMARRLLEESGGDLTWTAAQMGIHPTTLYRWRKSGKV